MKKAFLTAAALAALSISPVRESRAGKRQTYPVVVDTSGRSATGVLGTARNTADTVQYIGCTVTRYADGGVTGWCGAYTASGVPASCTTDQPALLDTMTQVQGDSYLQFTWNAGECTKIMVSNYSSFEPKS